MNIGSVLLSNRFQTQTERLLADRLRAILTPWHSPCVFNYPTCIPGGELL